VVILNKEGHFYDKYSDLLDVPHKVALKSAHLNGIILGFTSAIMFYAIAAAFSLGAYLVQKNLFNQDLESIMLVFNCVLFGAQSVGQAAAILPDYNKAVLSVQSMFALFERVPLINNWGDEMGEKISDKDFDGNIELKQIEFTYPARKNQQILKKIDLTIKKGRFMKKNETRDLSNLYCLFFLKVKESLWLAVVGVESRQSPSCLRGFMTPMEERLICVVNR